MNNKNKHGLSRNIPESIKRAVRERCKFGCIICGNLLYAYDHFDPEFNDAHEHHPNGITLLCDYHHRQKTNKLISLETIRHKNDNPFNVNSDGATFKMTDLTFPLELEIGQISLLSPTGDLITVEDKPILSLTPPVTNNEPPLINLQLKDSKSANLCIRDNEIIVGQSNYDCNFVRNKLSIHKIKGESFIKFEFYPPAKIVISDVNLELTSCTIQSSIKTKMINMKCGQASINLEYGKVIAGNMEINTRTGFKFSQGAILIGVNRKYDTLTSEEIAQIEYSIANYPEIIKSLNTQKSLQA